MSLSLIVAIAENNAIGYQNQLIYHLSNDLKRFKTLTTGHTVLMGRKTFESLPKGALPNRRNMVLSRQKGLHIEGAECFASLEDALAHCRAEEEVYIMGGASLYEQALPLATKLYVTQVHHTPALADAFFPVISPIEWVETEKDAHPIDEKHPFAYTFETYERRRS